MTQRDTQVATLISLAFLSALPNSHNDYRPWRSKRDNNGLAVGGFVCGVTLPIGETGKPVVLFLDEAYWDHADFCDTYEMAPASCAFEDDESHTKSILEALTAYLHREEAETHA